MNLERPRDPVPGVPPVLGERASGDHELEAGAQGWYVCAACDERLAREDWLLQDTTQAPLVFANPHGRFFELLLVTHICGGVFDRQATSEFTWFSGYAWRVGNCAGCRAHIGWHFEATQRDLALREFVALSRTAVKFLRSE
jgi:hypothetical protein